MARPKLPSGDRREETLGVRLSAGERTQLDLAAAAHGITAAEFMRRRALGYRLPATIAETRSRSVLATSFLRLGNNLNQLAHHANTGRYDVFGWQLQQLIERINTALDEHYGPGSDERRPEL